MTLGDLKAEHRRLVAFRDRPCLSQTCRDTARKLFRAVGMDFYAKNGFTWPKDLPSSVKDDTPLSPEAEKKLEIFLAFIQSH